MEEPIVEDGRRRQNTEQQTMNNQDRFSKLPELLIIHILSLLDMEEAVKTSILSKRWKNLWTRVYNIVYSSYEIDNDGRWLSFVDHTLMQCTANIKTFSLSSFASFSDFIIDRWISYVLANNVENFKLYMLCNVPNCLFQSSSITTLELAHVKMNKSPPVNWSSLKSLLLEYVIIDDKFFEKILTGCPVLENISLGELTGIRRLSIMSTSVKVLKLWNFENGGDFLEIRAPWLRELKISGGFLYTRCELVDIFSLLKTTLTFHTHMPAIDEDTVEYDMERKNWVTQYNYSWIPMVYQLLKSLSYVGELIIGSEPIQVLSFWKLLDPPSPLFMCKHLSIETYLWKFDLPGIAFLLKNAPHLETLFIKVVADWEDVLPLSETQEPFWDGDPHLCMPSGTFLHLKDVKIDYWRQSYCDTTEHMHGEFFDFELVEFILRSAVVLDKLVLCSSRSTSCFHICPVPNCSFQYVPRLSSKLITTFLNGIDAAEWELKKSEHKYEFTFPNYESLRRHTSSLSAS